MCYTDSFFSDSIFQLGIIEGSLNLDIPRSTNVEVKDMTHENA